MHHLHGLKSAFHFFSWIQANVSDLVAHSPQQTPDLIAHSPSRPLIWPIGTMARECEQNDNPRIGAADDDQLLFCAGVNGTAKLVGNVDVQGRVSTTEPSERERALERNLTAAFQRIAQHLGGEPYLCLPED